MPRLALPQVTLVAVDARSPALALASLRRSMAQADFGRVLLFTHGPALREGASPGVELHDSGPIASGADYSRFVLRELPAHVATSHVLVTQWDGFVIDAGAWSDEFLAFDYLGAPWPDQPEALAVGNGGFSLRSQRLLQAGRDPRIEPMHPEDVALCRTHRGWLEREQGLRFAPRALATRFAFENARPRGPCFGFHGPHNLPRVLGEPELLATLQALPDAFFRSRDARRLARALLARRMPDAARALLARRRAAGHGSLNTTLMDLAARLLAALR